MTPKEKAKQLYDKMEFETKYNSQPSTVNGMCKKLALVCVEEILEIIRYHGTDIGKHSLKYWLDVKQELSL